MPTTSITSRPHSRPVALLAAALPLALLGTACGSGDSEVALKGISTACNEAMTQPTTGAELRAVFLRVDKAVKRSKTAAKADATWAPTAAAISKLDTAQNDFAKAARAAAEPGASLDAVSEAGTAMSDAQRTVASRCVKVRKAGGKVDQTLIEDLLHPKKVN